MTFLENLLNDVIAKNVFAILERGSFNFTEDKILLLLLAYFKDSLDFPGDNLISAELILKANRDVK
jgi:hypothetical protein